MTETVGRRVYAGLESVRSSPRVRWPIVVGAIALGGALSLSHWSGFVAIGIAVGLVSPSLRHAIGVAVAIALTVVIAFVGYAWFHGQVGAVVGFGELFIAAVVIPVTLLVLGALIRGLG